eukprot:6200984-Pleurochrysis_carterae.AAC.1
MHKCTNAHAHAHSHPNAHPNANANANADAHRNATPTHAHAEAHLHLRTPTLTSTRMSTHANTRRFPACPRVRAARVCQGGTYFPDTPEGREMSRKLTNQTAAFCNCLRTFLRGPEHAGVLEAELPE